MLKDSTFFNYHGQLSAKYHRKHKNTVSMSKLWITFLSVSESFSPPKLRSRIHSTHLWSLKPGDQVMGGEIQSVILVDIDTNLHQNISEKVGVESRYLALSCFIMLCRVIFCWNMKNSFWLQRNLVKLSLSIQKRVHKIAAGSCIWIFQVHGWRKISYEPVFFTDTPPVSYSTLQPHTAWRDWNLGCSISPLRPSSQPPIRILPGYFWAPAPSWKTWRRYHDIPMMRGNLCGKYTTCTDLSHAYR